MPKPAVRLKRRGWRLRSSRAVMGTARAPDAEGIASPSASLQRSRGSFCS